MSYQFHTFELVWKYSPKIFGQPKWRDSPRNCWARGVWKSWRGRKYKRPRFLICNMFFRIRRDNWRMLAGSQGNTNFASANKIGDDWLGLWLPPCQPACGPCIGTASAAKGKKLRVGLPKAKCSNSYKRASTDKCGYGSSEPLGPYGSYPNIW